MLAHRCISVRRVRAVSMPEAVPVASSPSSGTVKRNTSSAEASFPASTRRRPTARQTWRTSCRPRWSIQWLWSSWRKEQLWAAKSSASNGRRAQAVGRLALACFGDRGFAGSHHRLELVSVGSSPRSRNALIARKSGLGFSIQLESAISWTVSLRRPHRSRTGAIARRNCGLPPSPGRAAAISSAGVLWKTPSAPADSATWRLSAQNARSASRLLLSKPWSRR